MMFLRDEHEDSENNFSVGRGRGKGSILEGGMRFWRGCWGMRSIGRMMG